MRNGDEITTQIDIIIFDNTYPLLFSEGDFVMTTSLNVIAIIEVKSNIVPNLLCKIVEKANSNAKIANKTGVMPDIKLCGTRFEINQDS